MEIIYSANIESPYLDVIGLPIRGFDWRMRRTAGALYATYAGPNDDADDETFNWEPADPEHQALVDQMSDEDAARWVLGEILKQIEAEDDEAEEPPLFRLRAVRE